MNIRSHRENEKKDVPSKKYTTMNEKKSKHNVKEIPSSMPIILLYASTDSNTRGFTQVS